MDVLLTIENGEHEHARIGKIQAQFFERLHAAEIGQLVVEDDHVGPVLREKRERFGSVLRLGDDLEIGLGVERHAQADARGEVVVHDEDAGFFHEKGGTEPGAGAVMWRRVPAPAGDSKRRVPASLFTRSRTPWRPKPLPRAPPSAPPWPSS